MKRFRCPLRVVVMLLLCWVGLSTSSCEPEADYIVGKIVVVRDGKAFPVPEARVQIVPLVPLKRGKEFKEEDPARLRGLATTQTSGTFRLSSLSSPVTHQEYPLLGSWRYTIQIEVPGYYITSSEFDFDGGNNFLEIAIEEKLLDVVDESGGIEEVEEASPTIGPVRR